MTSGVYSVDASVLMLSNFGDGFPYLSTNPRNPPHIIRLKSNGMYSGLPMRGSFMTFSLIRSRSSRDG